MVLFITAVVIGLFELLPMVEYGRFHVPDGVMVTKTCDCVANTRPWYSAYNYWFWVTLVPILVFSVKPDASRKYQILRTILAIGLCYWAMDSAQQLMWDIRNGIFSDTIIPNSLAVECINTSDGASLLYTRLLGWLYGTAYAGLWLMIWRKYHEKRTKQITQDYQWGQFHRWVIKISILVLGFDDPSRYSLILTGSVKASL